MKKQLYLTTLLSAVILAGCGSAVTPSSAASDIGEAKAKAIAMEHAKVKEAELTKIHVEKETKKGKAVYDIEFETKTKEYDYTVTQEKGEILSSSISNNTNDDKKKATEDNKTADKNTQNDAQTNATESTDNHASSQPNTSDSTKEISAEKAKAIALAHAKVTENNTQLLKVKKEREDGIKAYSVEFYVGNTEYDYDIARSNGKIIQYDIDVEEQKHHTPSTSIISLAKARSIALQKVPGATSKNIHLSLDDEDGKQVYEGEIKYKQMEYDFEIDAKTGNFLKWTSERDDD